MVTVRQLLNIKGHDVWSTTPDATVYSAIADMAEHGVGALVVLNDDVLVGIISERDYATKVVLQDRWSRETPVNEIMTPAPITIDENYTVDDCMRLMSENRVRHLPVVDAGRVVGMISIGDVLKQMLSEQKQTIQQLENYITGNA